MKRIVQYLMAASLAYAAYTMATCPCGKACACKFDRFLITTGIPLAYVIIDNFDGVDDSFTG